MFKKIIVRLPNWIGDFVMATPVLIELRRRFSDASITAMCTSSIAELLKCDPSVDEILSFSYHNLHHDEIEKIRQGNYDLGVLLPNSFSSAWCFWLGRVPRRLGYAGNWRSWLLTDKMEPPETRLHQVEFYKYLLQPLGIPMSETAPRLTLRDTEKAAAKQLLFDRGYREGQPLYGINPGAAFGPAKCWPADRYRALAKRLLENPKNFVVFFGDAPSQIHDGLSDRAINFSGSTNLRELSSLIQCCDVLISNDSGPMHIGAALGTPIVALFGSTDDSATGPWGQKGAVISKHVSCSPCFKRTCPKDFRCMLEISVDEVVQKAIESRIERV